MQRRLAHHVVFQRPADFDEPQQRLTLEPHHGRHQPPRGLDLCRQISAIAPPAPDDPQPFPAVECLADGRPAHAERGGQRHFGRQPVADLEPGALHHFGKRIQHRHIACAVLQRLEIAQGSVPTHGALSSRCDDLAATHTTNWPACQPCAAICGAPSSSSSLNASISRSICGREL
ncbi:hypothetical protein D3C87_1553530 [compost metagenome]